MTADPLAAGPAVDQDSARFWHGLGEGRILLQKCSDCSEIRFPPMPGCPHCGSPAFFEAVAGGQGRVYSYIVVHRPLGSITEAELPCVIATVELAEGCRVLGRLSGGEAEIHQPVRARFVDHETWTELAFVPVEA